MKRHLRSIILALSVSIADVLAAPVDNGDHASGSQVDNSVTRFMPPELKAIYGVDIWQIGQVNAGCKPGAFSCWRVEASGIWYILTCRPNGQWIASAQCAADHHCEKINGPPFCVPGRKDFQEWPAYTTTATQTGTTDTHSIVSRETHVASPCRPGTKGCDKADDG
jgi:hypothetical protein